MKSKNTDRDRHRQNITKIKFQNAIERLYKTLEPFYENQVYTYKFEVVLQSDSECK